MDFTLICLSVMACVILSSFIWEIRAYEDFHWFKNVPIDKILDVAELTPGHLHWPQMDVDLGIETIEHQQCFPLKSK